MLRAVMTTALVVSGLMLGAASQAEAQELVPCASEGGFCRVPYPTRVIYGVPGSRAERFVRDGIPCSNSVFGDPAPGVPKRCAFFARGRERGPSRWDDGHRERPRWRDERREHDRYGHPHRTEYRPYY
jgi:hypothetical protein